MSKSLKNFITIDVFISSLFFSRLVGTDRAETGNPPKILRPPTPSRVFDSVMEYQSGLYRLLDDGRSAQP